MNALVQYVDVAPTFLTAAGIAPASIDVGCPDARGAPSFDGRSFLDVLTGKPDKLRDVVFAQHTTVGIHGFQDPYHQLKHARRPGRVAARIGWRKSESVGPGKQWPQAR